MPYQGIDYERKLTLAYYFGLPILVMCILGGAVFWPRSVTPELSYAKVFGCYANNLSPPISLRGDGMRILQDGFPLISYRLERNKQGIVLTAGAPISASPTAATYTYSISSRGSGKFLYFYNVINGQRHSVFDDTSLDRFAMLAEDGSFLLYVKGPQSGCESRRTSS